MLVHGAWADSSSWNAVVEQLQALGYTVDAPPNPLRGVSTDSAYLSDFLSTISGPIVLVGHSYGGFVITNAATGNPQVKALVYDDAFIPAAGDTRQSLSAAKPGSCLAVTDPSTVLNFAPYPAAPASPPGDADAYVKQSVFPGCFANGLPASEGAALAAEQQPLAASALSETLTAAPAWQTIPSWAVIGTADHVIPPAEQLAMAQRAGAHITQIRRPAPVHDQRPGRGDPGHPRRRPCGQLTTPAQRGAMRRHAAASHRSDHERDDDMTAATSLIDAGLLYAEAPNGISYAYRRFGNAAAGVPVVFLQHFRGNIDNWDPALINAVAARPRGDPVQQRRRGGDQRNHSRHRRGDGP